MHRSIPQGRGVDKHDIRTVNMRVFIWGSTIYDEFHNAKADGSLIHHFYKELRLHNKGLRWKSWAMSGTPWETGMNEALIFISMLSLERTRG